MWARYSLNRNKKLNILNHNWVNIEVQLMSSLLVSHFMGAIEYQIDQLPVKSTLANFNKNLKYVRENTW